MGVQIEVRYLRRGDVVKAFSYWARLTEVADSPDPEWVVVSIEEHTGKEHSGLRWHKTARRVLLNPISDSELTLRMLAA